MNLRVPGPTPLPPEALSAQSQQMMNHRGPEFAELLGEIAAQLKSFFRTTADVLIVTASGTGGMEAALVNFLSPGDPVLAVVVGAFGRRFAEIADAYGARVRRLEFPWGEPAAPDAIRRELEGAPDTRAILVTHNETSTGVTNDLAAISHMVREVGDARGDHPLLIVDAISSLGAVPFEMDAWGCDVVVTGSQKAWMAPPGLCMIGVSEHAWEENQRARMPRFYWDLAAARRYAQRDQTPFTPAVSVMYGLRASLQMMASEGLDRILLRHRDLAGRCRDGLRRLGLEVLAPESHASSTVTAVRADQRVGDVSRFLARLRQEKGLVLAGGQGELKGKIFRIGHLGYVREADIDVALRAIEEAL